MGMRTGKMRKDLTKQWLIACTPGLHTLGGFLVLATGLVLGKRLNTHLELNHLLLVGPFRCGFLNLDS